MIGRYNGLVDGEFEDGEKEEGAGEAECERKDIVNVVARAIAVSVLVADGERGEEDEERNPQVVDWEERLGEEEEAAWGERRRDKQLNDLKEYEKSSSAGARQHNASLCGKVEVVAIVLERPIHRQDNHQQHRLYQNEQDKRGARHAVRGRRQHRRLLPRRRRV